MTISSVTVLGGGPMARAIGRTLVGAGRPTVVWNRTPQRLDELVTAGARQAASASEAVAASPLVLVNLVDHDAVDAVLECVASYDGRLVVGLTSDVPDRSRRTARLVESRGGSYLDGSVMTPAGTIGTEAGGLLVSGPESAADEARPVLELLGTTQYVGAEVGAAAALDIAALDLFWSSIAGYLHALAVADGEGLTARDLLPHAHGMVAILPAILDDVAARVDDDRHDDPTATVDSVRTSVGHIRATAVGHGLDTSALDAYASALDRVAAAGHGEDGFTRASMRPDGRDAP